MTTEQASALILAMLLNGGCNDETSPSPEIPEVVAIEANSGASCAISDEGSLRCWGNGRYGWFANGSDPTCASGILSESCIVGDDELPSAAPALDIGGSVRQVSIGNSHICAVLQAGTVRCWGEDLGGALLGLQGQTDGVVGDDEPASSMPVLEIEGEVSTVAAGLFHTCVLLTTGAVRCWGLIQEGSELGNPSADILIGDDERPDALGDVPTHGAVAQLEVQGDRTCVIVEGGRVRCWGGEEALRGVPNPDYPIAEWDDVPVPVVATDLAMSDFSTCVLDDAGEVWCWGYEYVLGVGETGTDQVEPALALRVPVGAPVVEIEGGGRATCAITDTGGVRCWGEILGHPGLDEFPGAQTSLIDLGDIDVGGPGKAISVGDDYGGCVLRDSGDVVCWGYTAAHGHPGVDILGDDEAPSAYGPVEVF
ncbi:RCC1 domain-containing protein [Nannocystaceae bacterium ST9]